MTELVENGGLGARRLVLGFDGGCMTCRDLAGRIDEAVGDKLEVRSLYDPQMEHWRRQALGDNPRWAPTLVEVEGAQGVRAWTGSGMAVMLTRALGPISTWHVMQALGEVGAPRLAANGSPVVRMSAAGMSRGQFLKGVGGAALAFGALSGAASPAQATGAEVDREALYKIFSAIADIPDSVLAQGDEATKQWLLNRLQVDPRPGAVQPRGIVGCISAVGLAIATNALPIFKIARIRNIIRAFGSVGKFVRAFYSAFQAARRRGLGVQPSIREGVNAVTRGFSDADRQALLDLFGLGAVFSACFE